MLRIWWRVELGDHAVSSQAALGDAATKGLISTRHPGQPTGQASRIAGFSITNRNKKSEFQRTRLFAFSKIFSRRAQVSTPRGSGILKGSSVGRGRRGLRGLAMRGGVMVHGNSTAKARHNGRRTRRACADSASMAAISGMSITVLNCEP